ncbi:DUF2793 domain-containing protein [Erythrobacter sp. THAF29]|uniref:DUF2793 domain-containing protein n=1 Tax=Erythrobacter sp. THAF29 TaxID=2587851 RepID=UPI001268E852|nr:DUF2793 domain-containing protein [Erythrobacter sp. THAF29]QFT76149.1 hypothetical protein FIU90_01205 [Erythrobacter sp. THAF29]
MTEPLTFASSTQTYSLPLLFAGQAQKEFFVNQALATIDSLLQLSVEASVAAPPADPADGSCFRIAGGATDDWAGKDDMLAIRISGAWQFVDPPAGTRLYDRAARQCLLFDAGWIQPAEPSEPAGGSVVDSEARAAINELISAMRSAGIFAG